MELIRLVIVEDKPKGGYELFDQFGPDGISPDIPDLRLDRKLSPPFANQTAEDNRKTLEQIRDGIALCQGPMILALDLDLSLGEESNRIRKEVRVLVEQILGPSLAGDLGEIDRQVDGLLIAVEAIKQRSIKPLVVAVLTSKGGNQDIEHVLNEFTKSQDREHEVKILKGSELGNRVLSAKGADSKYVTDLFNDIAQQFQTAFGGQVNKFFNLLDAAGVHGSLDDNPKAEVTRLLSVLLDLAEEEFTSQIWETWSQSLTKPVTETVKDMGINERERLSATAAWFFALAAYRHTKDPRDWQTLFDIKELVKGLETYYLTPPQNKATFRHTTICFYDMCRALFSSEQFLDGNPQPGPLVRVMLSKERGLRMLLNFDCAPETAEGNRKSLYEQVGRWRNNSIGWEPKNTSYDARTTSRTVWRFWLASSVGNNPLTFPEDDTDDVDGVFGSNLLWRMNIFRRPAGRSEVVFNGR